MSLGQLQGWHRGPAAGRWRRDLRRNQSSAACRAPSVPRAVPRVNRELEAASKPIPCTLLGPPRAVLPPRLDYSTVPLAKNTPESSERRERLLGSSTAAAEPCGSGCSENRSETASAQRAQPQQQAAAAGSSGTKATEEGLGAPTPAGRVSSSHAPRERKGCSQLSSWAPGLGSPGTLCPHWKSRGAEVQSLSPAEPLHLLPHLASTKPGEIS